MAGFAAAQCQAVCSVQIASSFSLFCFLLTNVFQLGFRFAILWVGSETLLVFFFCLIEFAKLDVNIPEAAPRATEIISLACLRRKRRCVLSFFVSLFGLEPV